ncbi:MAG: sulfurtransferase [Bacillaceae bacterium]|nr:sulfurtransferase [Bacillaceae bacterium]
MEPLEVADSLHNIVMVDCTFYLGESMRGKEEYLQEHIPTAIYFHLDEDLSGEVSLHGGRHPLPNIADFTKKLENIGISNETKVVVYDRQKGAMASRFWWLLTYLGHENVYVLNGGFQKWKECNFTTASGIEKPRDKGSFKVEINESMLVSMQDVKNKLNDVKSGTVKLIDSREPARFKGEVEPIDKKAGHIPGAINEFWANITNDSGFKTVTEWMDHFSHLEKDKETIVYCGSGVTACPNVLALKAVGFTNVKLYAGSWSDWISYDDNPVEKA